MSEPAVLIRELADTIGYFDPTQLGRTSFRYIDISSIDRKAKRIVAPIRTTVAAAPSRARLKVASGDVLVSTVRPNLNAVAIVPPELDGEIASTGFTVLRARPQLLPEYLFYFAQSPAFVRQLVNRANGANYPAVTDDDVLDVTIPTPCLPVQGAIVESLRSTNRIRLIRRFEMEMCAGLLGALFLEMFGDRRNPKNGCTWSPASELCESITDCVNKTAPLVEFVTPYRMLRTTNVRHGEIDVENVRYVDKATYEKWTRRSKPMWGDVILTREAPLGQVGILRSDANVFLGQRLVQYRVDASKATPEFLAYGLMSKDVQIQIHRLGDGSTVEHVAVPDCESLLVPSAPLQIQRRFSAVERLVDRSRATQREALRQADHLFQALLSEAFGCG